MAVSLLQSARIPSRGEAVKQRWEGHCKARDSGSRVRGALGKAGLGPLMPTRGRGLTDSAPSSAPSLRPQAREHRITKPVRRDTWIC